MIVDRGECNLIAFTQKKPEVFAKQGDRGYEIILMKGKLSSQFVFGYICTKNEKFLL